MRAQSGTRIVLGRITASAVALILAASGPASYARFALAEEVDAYAEVRDEATVRAEEAEAERTQAQQRAEEAEQKRDEANARAEAAEKQRDEASAQADDAQARIAEAKATLNQLFLDLEQAYADLGKAEYDLAETKQQIEELKSQISESESTLETNKDVLMDQVAATYRSGKVDLLSLVLGSSSFEELTARMTYANRISEQHIETIRTVKECREELDHQQDLLAVTEAEQQQLVERQSELAAAAAEAERVQHAYLQSLNAELVEAINAERDAAAEQSLALAEAAQAGNDADKARSEEAAAQLEAANQRAEAAEAERNRTNAERAAAMSVVYSSVPRKSSTATNDQRLAAVQAALTQVGVPYELGSENPGVSFDCNSLTHWSWAQAGVDIPYGSGRTCYGQFQWMMGSGHWVTSVEELLPGDLVFYSHDGGATTYHVAMYVGGGQVVHANGYLYGVMVSSIFFDDGFCGGGSPL